MSSSQAAVGDSQGCHGEDLIARLDKRQLAALEVGRPVWLGVDLRELLEVGQPPLVRGGVVEGVAENGAVGPGLRRASARLARSAFDGDPCGQCSGMSLRDAHRSAGEPPSYCASGVAGKGGGERRDRWERSGESRAAAAVASSGPAATLIKGTACAGQRGELGVFLYGYLLLGPPAHGPRR